VTFISVVARKSFITLMTDGRVSWSSAEVDQENFKKFKKVSNDQFIAFSGHKELCENVVNQIEYTHLCYNLYDLSTLIYDAINGDGYHKQFHLFFVIGGIDVNNEISLYVIDNHKNFLLFKPTDENDLKYTFTNHPQLDQKFNELLDETGSDTAMDCIKAQKLLNDIVANIDDTVNTNTFELSIEK
jgi:hypothetical protein